MGTRATDVGISRFLGIVDRTCFTLLIVSNHVSDGIAEDTDMARRK